MEELKLMPDHLDLREVTFTNLLLLGFDVDAKESEYRIPFNRDMFATPNKRGMEIVLHFLFTRLDRDVAKETFRSCWFPHEKAQSQEFRKHCIDWLNKLKKQPDCAIPMASPSLLLSPTGNKFYQFLFYFSMYVLKKRMEAMPKKHGSPPSRSVISTVAKTYTHQMVKGQYVSTVNEMERLICYLNSTEVVKEKWQETASNLSKGHKATKKKKKECEKMMTESMERSKLLFGKSSFTSKDVLRRTQDMQKVTDVWNTLTKFYDNQKNLKQEIEYGIINNENGYCLDGKTIDFKLPDLLVRECERQMHMGNQYENIYKEGKIDLTSLLRMWNLSLCLVKEALMQYPLPDVIKDSEFIKIQAHNHENMLKDTIILKHMLSNEVTDLNISIETLKEEIDELYASLFNASVFTPKVPHNFTFDILPCTPGFKFEALDNSEENDSTQDIFTYGSQVVATPEAVRVMLDTLEDTVVMDAHTPVNAGISKLLSKSRKLCSGDESNKNNKEESKDNKGECKNQQIGPKFGKKAKSMRKSIALSKIPTLKGRNQKENVKPFAHNADTNMAEAQRILIDQITDSIISTNPNIADNDLLDLHAFEKPYEAFSADVFLKQDKVMRTPETRVPLECKDHALIENKTITPLQVTPLANDLFKQGPSQKEYAFVDNNTITPSRNSPLIKDITPLKGTPMANDMFKHVWLENHTSVDNRTVTPSKDSPLDMFILDSSPKKVEEISHAPITPLLPSNNNAIIDSLSSWWSNTPEFNDNCSLLTPTVLTPTNFLHENTLENLESLKYSESFEDDDDDEL